MGKERFKWETRGKALNDNVITGENYRFTVLTSRMIRMEYAADGVFEDRATQYFFYRDFEKNEYLQAVENGVLTIETSDLLLTYQKNAEFAVETLSVQLKNFPGSIWHFGESADQLKGTAKTLDLANGEIPLQDGLCSRNGYTVVDDSETLVLTNEGWFDVRNAGIKDLYFFGYGHDYLGCIQDFYRITGAPPLLPDYALGNWWSRYYDYTQQEYCDLMERFEREQIPFSVAVVDMGWHTQPKNIEENRIADSRWQAGWTGYSWNKELFPDYKEFLKFLKEHNLKTALNLHPAAGIGCHEDMYEEMATACGIDPASRRLVKFDGVNPEFMEHYFDIVHHPYEEAGVDFWWMDWQQGTDYWWIHDEDHPASPLEKMDPLWLLNHLHILDISRNGKRPMFFSRYSGLGSHRYPVGFSGDTLVTWESLDFQPYFTANASNAGYSWWSHDIGGHREGYRDDEMVVRWMQLGVLSPINRLHSAINWFTGKEPWNLHPYMAGIATEWLQFRHRLFPYIYTMNYRNHVDLIPLVLPMYYSHPEKDAAYQCPNQYWFGSEFIVCPITDKADSVTFLAKTNAWLPEGKWIDAFNGFVYEGDTNIDIYRGIEQFSIFAKTGAIVPMEKFSGNNKMGRSENMELFVFAGADNSFTLYEDEGEYSRYQEGVWSKTQMNFVWKEDASSFQICPAEGDISLLPKKRNWTVHFRGFEKPESVVVKTGKRKKEIVFTYDEKHATVTVVLENIAITNEIEISCIAKQGLLYQNTFARKRMFDIVLHAQMGYVTKTKIWEYLNRPKHDRLFMIVSDPQHQVLLRALQEMLILEEYKK